LRLATTRSACTHTPLLPLSSSFTLFFIFIYDKKLLEVLPWVPRW
jgi:hypothetical protein